jgi:hypothetical protein
VGLTNLGSESETCVGSRVHLVGVSISFEKNFYRLPFTPPLSGSPYRSFSASSTPSCFPRRTDLLGNPFLITLLLDLLFLLFFFLDHHAGHPTRHNARILLMSASSMPSKFFIVVSIYWKPASYRSSLGLPSFGKDYNRSAAKLICFFFYFLLDRRACYSTCR